MTSSTVLGHCKPHLLHREPQPFSAHSLVLLDLNWGDLRRQIKKVVRKRGWWSELGDSPAAKESAGTLGEMFIILSLAAVTCGPFGERKEKSEAKVGLSGMRDEIERQWEWGLGNGKDPSLLCSPDVSLCAGLWDRPSLVKPTDSTRRTAVHRSLAPPLTAQMWDRQIPLFVYTWSFCMYCAYLLAFRVRVVFHSLPWQPLFCMVMVFWSFCIWQLMTLEVLWVHATMSMFKRLFHFRPLYEQDCTWCRCLGFIYHDCVLLLIAIHSVFSFVWGFLTLFAFIYAVLQLNRSWDF